MVECMIRDCTREPTERVTLNDQGILLVYAVCAHHRQAMRKLTFFPEPDASNRGLMGVANT